MNKFQMDGRAMPDQWEAASYDQTGKGKMQHSIHPNGRRKRKASK